MKLRYSLIIFLVIFAMPFGSHAVDIGKVVGSAVGGVSMLADAAKDITPSEEHYIGRAVAAIILSKYPLLNNDGLTKYVNKIGLLIAAVSDRPSTFGGYHFAVLNNNEPNAYACPGGIVLINKGLLKEVKNEDQLAAVLAHEVAHVANRHGINAIKKSRWTKLGFYAASEVGKNYSSGDVGQLVDAFGGVVQDVAKKVMESGYSQSDEKKADSKGLEYMAAVGYNSQEMIEFIKVEESAGLGKATGPFSSHPKPAVRIKQLEKKASSLSGGAKTEAVRTSRFKTLTASAR